MATANQTISEGLDFDQLRAEGIRQFQRLSSGRWTDFNTHDPGITLLDVFCYALTDLAYRSNWSIPDLLGAESVQRLQDFFGMEKVLPSAPLTFEDLSKRLLDIKGVQNAHIEPLNNADSDTPTYFYSPYEKVISVSRTPIDNLEASQIQGFYSVSIAGKSDNVIDVLNNCRPLACDWKVVHLNSEKLKLVLALEISVSVTQPNRLAFQVKEKIMDYITPSVKTTSYAEERHKGTPSDIVYDGPLRESGFLADSELNKLAFRDTLRISDIIQILMDIPGVVAVKDIYFGDNKQNPWLQPIKPQTYPLLNEMELHLDIGNQRTSFTLESLKGTSATNISPYNTNEQRKPQTAKRAIDTYHSIRHHLPAIYGLNEDKVANMTIPAKQLRGYLIFFEQFLADAFAQLAQAESLFDFNNAAETSYAVKKLRDAVDFMKLPHISNDHADFLKELKTTLQTAVDPLAQRNDRLNRLLDHLMARFAEDFSDYSLLMHHNAQELIADKQAFVKAIPDFGLNRGLSFNYKQTIGKNEQVFNYTEPESRSGLENRIALMLGMNTPFSGFEENFYLIEHLFLRPVDQDASDDDNLISFVAQPDPYSRTVTFVFPSVSSKIPDANTSDKSSKTKWQYLTEKMARRETPAHLQLNIIWLNKTDFETFSTAYIAWRKALAHTEGVNNAAYRVARDRIVDLLVDKDNNFLIGWHRPILDLNIENPFVAANTEGVTALLYNSQEGVEYTLCDYRGNPIPESKVKPLFTAEAQKGTGQDLPIKLPGLPQDKTFRILAKKKITNKEGKTIKETKAFLFQKMRVRVGIDVNIPVMVQQTDIRFGLQAVLTLQRSQAQVNYRLLDANDVVISPNFIGQQDQALSLTSNKLQEDSEIRIQAERSGLNENKVLIVGKYPIRVLPNQDLKLVAKTVVVDYGKTAKIDITKAQVGVSYFLVASKILQNYLVHSENPKTWTDSLLAVALPNVNIWNFNFFIPQDDFDYEQLSEFEENLFALKAKPNPRFLLTGEPVIANQATIEIETGVLTSDTFLLTTAKKQNHSRGVGEIQVVPVLVMPNLAVVATPSATSVKKGETVTIQIAEPQAYTLYSLVVKGASDILSVGFHVPRRDEDPLGLDATRIDFDFVIGSDTEGGPVVLRTPPLTEKTEFEIIAEKVRTGLNGKLVSTIVIDVTEPEPPVEPIPDAVPPVAMGMNPVVDTIPPPPIMDNPVAETVPPEALNVLANTTETPDTAARGLMDMTEEKPKAPKKPRKPYKPRKPRKPKE